ncbi:MAG: hypothetical protein M3Q99_05430 [Acidobacteriota bacterium]|nr:hypothetical protein [Acidobacteriota bacterium]
MINETNKEAQNDKSTGNFGGGTSAQSAKDNTSSFGSKSDAEGLNLDSAKETAKGLLDQAKSTAGQAYGVAAEKATTKIEEKKTDLASGLTSVADTIRQVSSTLRETDEQTGVTDTAAKYSDSLAKQIEQVSNYFERNDVREMVGDVEKFARKNPIVFIGGAFAVGLLAARFLKSSGSGQSSSKGLKGRNLNTPLLKAKNDSAESNDFGSSSTSAKFPESKSETAKTNIGTTDYSSTSSISDKSSTGTTDTKSSFGDNKTTNPS